MPRFVGNCLCLSPDELRNILALENDIGKAAIVQATFRAYRVDPATGTPLDGVWYVSTLGCTGGMPDAVNDAVRRRLWGVHAVPNCTAEIQHSAEVHTHKHTHTHTNTHTHI